MCQSFRAQALGRLSLYQHTHQYISTCYSPPLFVLAMKPTPHASRSFTNGVGPSNMFCVSPSLSWNAFSTMLLFGCLTLLEVVVTYGEVICVWNASMDDVAAEAVRTASIADWGSFMICLICICLFCICCNFSLLLIDFTW